MSDTDINPLASYEGGIGLEPKSLAAIMTTVEPLNAIIATGIMAIIGIIAYIIRHKIN